MGARRAVAPSEKGPQAVDGARAHEAPEPVTSEAYPRRARLARGPDLEACWHDGRRVRTVHFDISWRPNLRARARAAIIVPRYQHTAVARNRLRRRLREILRRGMLAQLPSIDVVVRAKRAAYTAPFAVLRAELAQAGAALR
jgi:ribonuclease P protein component